MSEYIRVLHRLHENERQAPAGKLAGPAPSADRPACTPPQVPGPPPLSVAAPDSAPYKQLYENLRLATGSGPTRRIVLAPVSTRERADAVLAGLAAHIAGLGFRVLLAELAMVGGRPILRQQRDASLASIAALGLQFEGDLIPLDLSSAASQDEVIAWLSTASRAADAILIQGAPLTESVDAALLARVCDGLVLIAQAGVTDRGELQQVAERVHAAGCTVLGTVLTGTTTHLPSWVRRLIERSERPLPDNDSEELDS